MRQSQYGFKHPDEGPAGSALSRGVVILKLHLGEFHIPVAILIPHKLVDGIGDIIKTVFGEPPGDLRFGSLKQADDPFVCE